MEAAELRQGLYLGDFQPELISPQPELPADAIEKGERFLEALGAFLETRSIRRRSSAKGGSPTRWSPDSRRLAPSA